MLYRVTHLTRYTYSELASICHNELHLVPRTTIRQRCIHYHLEVSPRPGIKTMRHDFFGNDVIFFTLQEPHRQLEVQMVSLVDVEAAPPPPVSPPWEQVARGVHDQGDPADHLQFVLESPHVQIGPELAAYARASFTPGRPIAEAAMDLTTRIHADFTYDPGATTIQTPLEAVFAGRRGVCQDFAHIALAGLRSLGLAARYVSGYLQTLPPPGRPRLIGADASHAWVSLFCGETGWIDLDPTNAMRAGDRHITVSWGRDYADVSPLKGVVMGGGNQAVTVSVDVAAVDQPASEPAAGEEQLLLPATDEV
ncbi:MAG: transglutaminase family protein [Candidatus Xenobia bacterium]